MTGVVVVSDTSVISNLIQIGQLPLLTSLFSEIVIPPTVFSEVMKLAQFGISVEPFVYALTAYNFRIQDIIDPLDAVAELQSFLDKGESEAIILAEELNADWLLIDERLGRKAASERGLSVIGLLGVLRLAKKENLIPLIKPLLDDLRNKAGFWFSDKLYQKFYKALMNKSMGKPTDF